MTLIRKSKKKDIWLSRMTNVHIGRDIETSQETTEIHHQNLRLAVKYNYM